MAVCGICDMDIKGSLRNHRLSLHPDTGEPPNLLDRTGSTAGFWVALLAPPVLLAGVPWAIYPFMQQSGFNVGLGSVALFMVLGEWVWAVRRRSSYQVKTGIKIGLLVGLVTGTTSLIGAVLLAAR